MSGSETKKSKVEEAVRRCYSTWSEDYYQEYYASSASYPPVHRELLKSVLDVSDISAVLDAGCGPASFLRELSGERYERYGFDLTPEMIDEARLVLRDEGVASDHLWTGSVIEPGAYISPAGRGQFDAALCVGVLPHIPEEHDETVIENLRLSVREGGLVVVEARNQLFSLFTLNRYSFEFFTEVLMRVDDLSIEHREQAVDELEKRFRMEIPPVRTGKRDEPGYDEVLSRTHNPHVLERQFKAAGFDDVNLLFYHFHCLPPMFEVAAPEQFRRMSLAIEDPKDWRGYYMASAFILAGRRI